MDAIGDILPVDPVGAISEILQTPIIVETVTALTLPLPLTPNSERLHHDSSNPTSQTLTRNLYPLTPNS